MDNQFHKILAESRILYTFTQFMLFEFSQRNKRQAAQGNCILLQYKDRETNQDVVYLKMNNYQYLKKINSSLFVRYKYDKSTAYFFFHETNNTVFALTTLNKSQYIPMLEQLLTQKATLIDYYSKHQIKLKIDYHCDNIEENQVIIHHNTAAKIGKSLGNFFGTISQKLSSPVKTAETKVQKVGRESFSENTRSKWESFKEKASSLNDKITEFVKPVTLKAGEIATKVSESYNKSQNSVIKSVRRFTKQAQNSINEGYIAEAKQAQEKEKAPENFQPFPTEKKQLRQGMINGQYPAV